MELIVVAQQLLAMGQDLIAVAGSLENIDRSAAGASFGETAIGLFRDRRARAQHFPGALFGEPAWDILLDLYIASTQNRRVSTTDPAPTSGIAATTGLRWLQVLETEGLVERVPDPTDGRRNFIQLTREGRTAMEGYLQSLCN